MHYQQERFGPISIMRQALAESTTANTTSKSKKHANTSNGSNGISQQQSHDSDSNSNDDSNDEAEVVGIAKGGHVVNRIKPGIVMENDDASDGDINNNNDSAKVSSVKTLLLTISIVLVTADTCLTIVHS
jgi:hypothetical protein